MQHCVCERETAGCVVIYFIPHRHSCDPWSTVYLSPSSKHWSCVWGMKQVTNYCCDQLIFFNLLFRETLVNLLQVKKGKTQLTWPHHTVFCLISAVLYERLMFISCSVWATDDVCGVYQLYSYMSLSHCWKHSAPSVSCLVLLFCAFTLCLINKYMVQVQFSLLIKWHNKVMIVRLFVFVKHIHAVKAHLTSSGCTIIFTV